jgi:hypothetical protein
VDIVERSTVEGVAEKGREEVFCLTQRLPLHRTQVLHSLNQGRELLLKGSHCVQSIALHHHSPYW